jgi:hypothetical protein
MDEAFSYKCCCKLCKVYGIFYNIIFVCGSKLLFDYRDVMFKYRIVYVRTYHSSFTVGTGFESIIPAMNYSHLLHANTMMVFRNVSCSFSVSALHIYSI